MSAMLAPSAEEAQEGRLRSLLRRTRADRRSLIGIIIIVFILLMASVGAALWPYDPTTADFTRTLLPPNRLNWFGTDELGRDVLARILAGARVSLLVGAVSVGIALAVGTAIGLAAGYVGGAVDGLLMRLMDVLFAFPSILLALAITAVLGPSLQNAILAIAVVYVPVFARMARGQTLVVREMNYVEAMRAMGMRESRIMIGTVLPNILPPLLVLGSLLFASAIITESYLSFLGLGIQPPDPSWGNMLKNAIGFLSEAPWMAWFPGVAIFLAVLGFNLCGDGLRDRLDPRDQ
ncbi:MAG: ABC transporter permease [Variibacter sp.]